MVKTRVALVDDHPLFRQGLRTLLEHEDDLCVVGEAENARQAYELAEAQKPDVIVLDMSLPGVDGVAATRELQRRVPGGRVLILSMHDEKYLVSRAIAAGASGYAIKTEPPERVVDAVRRVARGERYLAPQIERLEEAPADAGPLGTLSQREREVFQLLIRGFSNQRAAKELCISVKTVETHRTHIHRKLGVHSVAELIRFAARHGLLRV
jgi:two-component system, NarL family, response regulator NreC